MTKSRTQLPSHVPVTCVHAPASTRAVARLIPSAGETTKNAIVGSASTAQSPFPFSFSILRAAASSTDTSPNPVFIPPSHLQRTGAFAAKAEGRTQASIDSWFCSFSASVGVGLMHTYLVASAVSESAAC